jgi:hypothetical protein
MAPEISERASRPLIREFDHIDIKDVATKSKIFNLENTPIGG